jgi:hypothetical protein
MYTPFSSESCHQQHERGSNDRRSCVPKQPQLRAARSACGRSIYLPSLSAMISGQVGAVSPKAMNSSCEATQPRILIGGFRNRSTGYCEGVLSLFGPNERALRAYVRYHNADLRVGQPWKHATAYKMSWPMVMVYIIFPAASSNNTTSINLLPLRI